MNEQELREAIQDKTHWRSCKMGGDPRLVQLIYSGELCVVVLDGVPVGVVEDTESLGYAGTSFQPTLEFRSQPDSATQALWLTKVVAHLKGGGK